jgi:hypothetical protein
MTGDFYGKKYIPLNGTMEQEKSFNFCTAETQEITIWNVNLFFVDLNLFRFFDAPKNNAREFAQSIESTLVPTFTLYIYTYIYIYLHIYIYTYILSCLE